MSVKKLGKALLERGLMNIDGTYTISYSLESSPGIFGVCYTEDMRQKLRLIAEPPEAPAPRFLFPNQAQKKAYEKEYNEYTRKKEKIYREVIEMILKEVLNKPLKLLQGRKNVTCFPIYLNSNKGASAYYIYKDNIYKFDRTSYSDEEIFLQIMNLEDEERRKFERLKHKFSQAERIDREGCREIIPEEVRIAVWRRDEGKCVKCSSRENLEYDHIIPVSKGGSNTVRNIELLCEKCNREKRDNIQ
jgi:hypothetical protein